jgi:hypothetical protein
LELGIRSSSGVCRSDLFLNKKTGWEALPKKYQGPDPVTGEELLVPKRLLVQHGLWEGIVESTMLSGGTDDQIREAFGEYGCSEKEIAGYLERFAAEELTMAAHA